MKDSQKSKSEKSRLELLHQYYSYTGFYSFVWQAVKKALPYIIGVVVLVYVINHFFDINEALTEMTEILPAWGVLSFFFVSETLLGLIPPEIFIAWSGKMHSPWFFLSLLAVLSYAGGLLAYWMGRTITKIPSVHRYLEEKMEKQLKNSRKWGGFLIVVGALLPLPFSISCIAAGIIKFPFRAVMLYGSLRLLRFVIYGLVIFHAL
ncbi:VTT domain-containing protein [Tamlana sp. 2_MG-2023]|uniref:YqaA family protein n=1 Tax=unclassified Tamlana TaxID=2614803 RepID=UPI0026E1AD5F|nr:MULTISPECIES: VTT domain-containing protein [unclassified Tamlana]MDO6759521.1 VTT domain-containing protein [Tamlana sp. 2_MG-2023]MDO6790340.1 VTT domain-containing protein [Tamlana sp. 1_MG-2023]